MASRSVWAARLAGRPAPLATHAVSNQGSLFRGNAFSADLAMRGAVAAFSPSASSASEYAGSQRLRSYGAWVGSESTAELARLANTHGPVLRQFNRNGQRVDQLEYHPSYHEIYRQGVEVGGVPNLAWRPDAADGGGSHLVRGAIAMLHYQAEPGTSCPLTMTYAAVPALRDATPASAQQPKQVQQSQQQAMPPYFAELMIKASSRRYDPRDVPLDEKHGAIIGMSMTEKTGGSDVRANTTVATPLAAGAEAAGEQGAPYAIRGHKWFTSAPGSDAFLTLAYVPPPAGSGSSSAAQPALSCFVVPRWLPDGTRNTGFRVMRLKDKVGDRSNASSEVEYDNAVGFLLGPVGRGVPTILEMVVHTRLDCALGSAGLMRQMTRHATHYVSQRKAFGMTLSDAPAMQAVLAELSVESEAAVAASLLLARSFDDCASEEAARRGGYPSLRLATAFRRLAVAAGKYYICKRAPAVAYEALESIGGNGFVEEWEMGRLYRQSPLNSVWEGSGNVIALDIQRTCAKEPAALLAFAQRIGSTAGDHPALAAHLTALLRRGSTSSSGNSWDSILAAMQSAAQGSSAAAGGAAGASSGPVAAALTDPLHARFVAEQLAVALMGHALALTKRAAAAAGGEAATRAADVLDLFCEKHMPLGSGIASAGSSSQMYMQSVMLGSALPPSAGGDASARNRLRRIVEADVAAIRAALC